jgi:hypothetical protein
LILIKRIGCRPAGNREISPNSTARRPDMPGAQRLFACRDNAACGRIFVQEQSAGNPPRREANMGEERSAPTPAGPSGDGRFGASARTMSGRAA